MGRVDGWGKDYYGVIIDIEYWEKNKVQYNQSYDDFITQIVGGVLFFEIVVKNGCFILIS